MLRVCICCRLNADARGWHHLLPSECTPCGVCPLPRQASEVPLCGGTAAAALVWWTSNTTIAHHSTALNQGVPASSPPVALAVGFDRAAVMTLTRLRSTHWAPVRACRLPRPVPSPLPPFPSLIRGSFLASASRSALMAAAASLHLCANRALSALCTRSAVLRGLHGAVTPLPHLRAGRRACMATAAGVCGHE
jgi:hypothetical protein